MATEPTPEQIEAFKAAWHAADDEGRTGERVRDGLAAALRVVRSDADLAARQRDIARELREWVDALTANIRNNVTAGFSAASQEALRQALAAAAALIEGTTDE